MSRAHLSIKKPNENESNICEKGCVHISLWFEENIQLTVDSVTEVLLVSQVSTCVGQTCSAQWNQMSPLFLDQEAQTSSLTTERAYTGGPLSIVNV